MFDAVASAGGGAGSAAPRPHQDDIQNEAATAWTRRGVLETEAAGQWWDERTVLPTPQSRWDERSRTTLVVNLGSVVERVDEQVPASWRALRCAKPLNGRCQASSPCACLLRSCCPACMPTWDGACMRRQPNWAPSRWRGRWSRLWHPRWQVQRVGPLTRLREHTLHDC